MSDYSGIVRRNHDGCVGYLVAKTPPCITIRDDEIQRIPRRLVALEPHDLLHLDPAPSWIMGVILCPGDDTKAVTQFANRTRASQRIRFYVHPDTQVSEAFSAWTSAGHQRARSDQVNSWKELHPLFGKALNDQVYEDFSGEP